MNSAEIVYIPVATGVRLAATSFGEIHKPVVILMHGAGQTRYSWRNAGQRLAEAGWRAVTVDTRGHGNSDWSADGDYSVDTLVSDLRVLARHFTTVAGVKPVLVGASLGGICGMLVEGETQAEIFRSMVLVDITPRIDNDGVARIIEFMSRHQSGFASIQEAAVAVDAYQSHRRREMQVEGSSVNDACTEVTRPEENNAEVTAAESNQVDNNTANSVRATGSNGLKKNLRLADDGRYYWHWDPRLMQHIGTIDEHFYLRQRNAAANLKLPVLLIRGQQSDIVSRESVDEFRQLVPHARFQDIADAAHMVAGDNNDIFAHAVLEFIGREQVS